MNASAMTETAQKPLTIILAAGGTGGHLFPAEGLAEELMRMKHHVVLITDKRFAGYVSAGYKGALSNVELHIIRTGSVRGGIRKKITGLFDVGLGILQARRLLRVVKPDVAIGFGGYPSFPTMVAASQMGVPTIIHEQNAILGRANRSLQGRVDRIATSYDKTGRIDQKNLKKTTLTGNPVRASIRALHDVPYPELTPEGTMRILVIGGSQGASVFSQIIPSAMATLPPAQRARIRIDQQCREADLDVTREAFAAIGVSVDLAAFFNDIPARLASAHLVISRAGASSVAELMVAGRPGILVPLPSAADNHQMINALAFEQAGGGWVMPQEALNAASLAARLETFLQVPHTLTKAARNARLAGHIRAAEDLAALVLSLAKSEDNGTRSTQPTTPSEFAA